MTLDYFKSQPFITSLKQLFSNLAVPVNYVSEAEFPGTEVFKEHFKQENPAHALIKKVYVLGTVDDVAFGETTILKETVTNKKCIN